MIRTATKDDIHYVAQCFIDISNSIKSTARDLYIDGLPNTVDQQTLSVAAHYIDNEQAITLIYEHEQAPVACLAASIENTSMPASGVGRVGNIAICWVDTKHRSQGLAKTLLQHTEQWFAQRGITTIELSYMAQNTLAKTAWDALGYQPFRIFAYKQISLDDK